MNSTRQSTSKRNTSKCSCVCAWIRCKEISNYGLVRSSKWDFKVCTPPSMLTSVTPEQYDKSRVCTPPSMLTSVTPEQPDKSRVCTPPSMLTSVTPLQLDKFRVCTPPSMLTSVTPEQADKFMASCLLGLSIMDNIRSRKLALS